MHQSSGLKSFVICNLLTCSNVKLSIAHGLLKYELELSCLFCSSSCRWRAVHRHNKRLQRSQATDFSTLQQRWPPWRQPGLICQLTGGWVIEINADQSLESWLVGQQKITWRQQLLVSNYREGERGFCGESQTNRRRGRKEQDVRWWDRLFAACRGNQSTENLPGLVVQFPDEKFSCCVTAEINLLNFRYISDNWVLGGALTGCADLLCKVSWDKCVVIWHYRNKLDLPMSQSRTGIAT